MGLLKALFGTPKPPARPYVDDGLKLTKRLIEMLNLPDWPAGTPVYTNSEERVISRSMRGAEQSLGQAGNLIDSDAANSFMRVEAANALHELAGRGRQIDLGENESDIDFGVGDEDWRATVSTYLKAWAMGLDPDVLTDLACLLAQNGHPHEGKSAAGIVAAWFPSYAPRFFRGTAEPSLVTSITERAREVMRDISNLEKKCASG